MLKLWHKFRSGPISSQVVATLIAALILAVAGWLAVVIPLKEIGAELLKFLSFSVALPVWLLVVALVGAAWITRRRIRGIKGKLAETLGQLHATEDALTRIKKEDEPEEVPVSPDFRPTDDQKRALTYLLQVFPTKKQLEDLHLYTRCANPALTAKELKGLIAAHVLKLEGTTYEFYDLTQPGLDAALQWCEGLTPRSRREEHRLRI